MFTGVPFLKGLIQNLILIICWSHTELMLDKAMIWMWPGWQTYSACSSDHGIKLEFIWILMSYTLCPSWSCNVHLLCSSSLPLALHFKLRFSQNMPIIPPQHIHIPSHHLCHLNPSVSFNPNIAIILGPLSSFSPYVLHQTLLWEKPYWTSKFFMLIWVFLRN